MADMKITDLSPVASLAAADSLAVVDDGPTETKRATLQQVLDLIATLKGTANGYASLDGDGTVPAAQLPDLSISQVHTVADQAAMLALDAEVGDLAIRTDESDARYILAGPDATDVANWIGLAHPVDAVTSVNGQTGTVALEGDDVNTWTAGGSDWVSYVDADGTWVVEEQP